MSVCVTVVNQYGNLKATKTPVADCQEYVLISAVDYQEYKEPVLFNGDLFLYVATSLLTSKAQPLNQDYSVLMRYRVMCALSCCSFVP